MIRYTKQRDRLSCGPTAILNALKWAGTGATYKEEGRQLIKDCRIHSKDCDLFGIRGVIPFTLDAILERKWICKHLHVKYCWSGPTIELLNNHLLSGGAAIIRYWLKHHFPLIGPSAISKDMEWTHHYAQTSCGHYVFCPGFCGKKYIIINDVVNNDLQTVCHITKRRMHRILCNKGRGFGTVENCIVWLLVKKVKS